MKKYLMLIAFVLTWKATWYAQNKSEGISPYTGEMTTARFDKHVKLMSKKFSSEEQAKKFIGLCKQDAAIDYNAVLCSDVKIKKVK